MFYKFEISGLYCGTSTTQVPYSTSVAPPDENATAKWVWNHVNWVGLPLDWEPIKSEQVPVEIVEEPVVEETPAESTPPTE